MFCKMPPDVEGYPCSLDPGHPGPCYHERPEVVLTGAVGDGPGRPGGFGADDGPMTPLGCRCAICQRRYHGGYLLDVPALPSAGGW